MVDQAKKKADKNVFRVLDEGKRFTENLIRENERFRLINVNLKP